MFDDPLAAALAGPDALREANVYAKVRYSIPSFAILLTGEFNSLISNDRLSAQLTAPDKLREANVSATVCSHPVPLSSGKSFICRKHDIHEVAGGEVGGPRLCKCKVPDHLKGCKAGHPSEGIVTTGGVVLQVRGVGCTEQQAAAGGADRTEPQNGKGPQNGQLPTVMAPALPEDLARKYKRKHLAGRLAVRARGK